MQERLIELRNWAMPALKSGSGDAAAHLYDGFEATWGNIMGSIELLISTEELVGTAQVLPAEVLKAAHADRVVPDSADSAVQHSGGDDSGWATRYARSQRNNDPLYNPTYRNDRGGRSDVRSDSGGRVI